MRINLAAIAANWLDLSQKISPAQCGAVVKADAYGLGMMQIAPALFNAGCRHFFVATLAEGLELRPIVDNANVMVFHGVTGNVADYISAQLTPVLNTHQDIAQWKNTNAPCWLHVDTGMNRLGFGVNEIPDVTDLNLTGLMSHLACADEPEQFLNIEQLKAFRALRQRFPNIPASLANSAGIFLGKEYHADITRPGIALYGGCGMRSVVSYHAPILQLRNLNLGDSVGYGATWQADRPTRLATIEAGYSEGFHRALFARGRAYIGETSVPMVGRISMDLITLDVTDVPALSIGSLVELLGDHQTIDHLAEAAGTINYEILTSLSPRVGRSYITE